MRSYRILVVEDEPALLRRICQKITQLGSPFELFGSAANGRQALALCEKQTPELVVTDILMNGMDGLSMLAELKKRGSFEAVIMSGYDDFLYAHQALQLGVSEYLLKPVSTEALYTALRKAADAYEKNRETDRARRLYRLTTAADGLREDEKYYRAALLLCGNISERQTGRTSMQSTEQQILRRFSPESVLLLPQDRMNERLLLLDAAVCGGDLSELLQCSAELHLICAPAPVPEHEVYALSQQLHSALYRSLHPWRSECITSEEEEPVGDPTLGEAERAELAACMLASDASALKKTLHRILQARLDLTQRLFERLLLRLLDVCFSLCENRTTRFERTAAIQDCIELVGSSKSFEGFFDAAFSRVEPLLLRNGEAALGKNGVMLRVKKYLQTNYMKELSLTQLAQMAGMDPASFTRAFRGCCGQSPMQYLILLRMEAAKRLLLEHPLLSVKRIGESVGYPDPFHFSKSFKKATGQSPSEYREQHQEDTVWTEN